VPSSGWKPDRGDAMTTLAPIIESFFTQRLMTQRRVSPHTVASYRDTFRLLLAFAQRRTGKAPSDLELTDVDAGLVSAFLDHLDLQ
jgi:integrase/recombinase XerD